MLQGLEFVEGFGGAGEGQCVARSNGNSTRRGRSGGVWVEWGRGVDYGVVELSGIWWIFINTRPRGGAFGLEFTGGTRCACVDVRGRDISSGKSLISGVGGGVRHGTGRRGIGYGGAEQ